MISMRKTLLLFFALLTISVPAMAGELSLSVAASLKEVINELSASYSKKKSGYYLCKKFRSIGNACRSD